MFGVTWHNVTNPGDGDQKLHSLYAPTSAPARDRPPDQAEATPPSTDRMRTVP